MTTLHDLTLDGGAIPVGAPARSGLRALVEAVAGPVELAIGALPQPVRPDAVVLLVLDDEPDAPTVDQLLAHLRAGGRAVVAAAPAALAALPLAAEPLAAADTPPLAAPSDRDPLVLDPRRTGQGRGHLHGLRLEADDLTPLNAGTVEVVADGQPVVVTVDVGPGRVVVIGSTQLTTDRWYAAADNTVIVWWALTNQADHRAGALIAAHRPGPTRPHAALEVVDNADDDALAALLPSTDVPVGSDEFLRAAAGRAGRLLSPAVHDALIDLVDHGAPAGGLLIRNLPIGPVPATPASPVEPTDKDHLSELVLLTVARRLGQPVGYEPEHGGDIVQNLLPTRGDVLRQTSTSSGVELAFHTETAFHPHKPRYLLLLCLRGEPEARTLLCSISQVVDRLPLGVRQVLREPRFRTAIDESFTGTRSEQLGRPMPVLGGSAEAPTLTFDADLMVGTDDDATAALEALRLAVDDEHIGVSLAAGDLLVIDNAVSVHGRSPFAARFDGTDRWLQRTFVVPDLAASATDRRGRVITTRFS